MRQQLFDPPLSQHCIASLHASHCEVFPAAAAYRPMTHYQLAPGSCPPSFAGELLLQVAELEAAGQMERERRREVEAALAEASAIFKRELADKSGQLELLRQEIKCACVAGRRAVWEGSVAGGQYAAGERRQEWQQAGRACAWLSGSCIMTAVPAHTRLPGAMRCRFLRTWGGDPGAVAASSVLDGSAPLLLPGWPSTAVTVTAPLGPCRSASPGATSLRPPTFHRTSGGGSFGHIGHCFSAPASPAPDAGTVAAAAARVVDGEVRALRSARRAYQRATLGQQELSASMARSIHDALRQGAPQVPLAFPHSAGSGSGGGGIPARRKWKRDLAAELMCGRAAAGGAARLEGALGKQSGGPCQWD